MNTSFQSRKGGVAKLISMTKLVDPIAYTPDVTNILNTSRRGAHTIDNTFTSPNMFKYIHSCGITPFSELALSDHRYTFIDVDLISSLQNKVENIINPFSRLLQSNDIKLVAKYKKIFKYSSNN